ncbi:MAG: DUF4230 domain-containing protein [Saprospiraceae bacterium]
MRSYTYLLVVLFAFGVGILCGILWSDRSRTASTPATLMLEKVKEVIKIVHLEAEFSELLEQKDYEFFNISPFRKSVIARARAKVLIGYDLDSSTIKADQSMKTITIQTSARPQILSTDIDIDYFDLQQGTFNQFTPEELNQLRDKVKDIVMRKASAAEYLERATIRHRQLMNTLRQYCEMAGWQLIIQEKPARLLQ